jgi:hypothetical protein
VITKKKECFSSIFQSSLNIQQSLSTRRGQKEEEIHHLIENGVVKMGPMSTFAIWNANQKLK